MGSIQSRVIASLFLLFSLSISVTAQEEELQRIFSEDDLSTLLSTYDTDNEAQYLHQSIVHEADQILAHLLEQDIDPNLPNESGFTPLHQAIMASNLNAFERLIDAGADVNKQRIGGLESTPLMYAVSQPGTDFSELLIANNADLNIVDSNLDPALNWAAYYGHVDQMELLIDSGADLTLESIHGNAADVVPRLWHADSVLHVFRSTHLMGDLSDQNMQLLQAVREENIPVVLDLLSEGVDPDSTDGLGNPLLQIAASNGNTQIVANFILNGADVNQFNRVGQTPLAFAARFGHEEIVDLLLEWEADVNRAGDEYQLTPLIGAAIGGDTGIGKKLLAAGAEIDHRDVINSGSPLLWAIMYSNTDFAEMLINEGAEFHSEDENVFSAYTFAQQMGNQHLVNLMESMME
ncbi:MAG: ankyrin repeat domain-containing protein [Balneolaceae bacterium]|nr:ankyrin repeat domain-containing protein [Balneolaceae bacterium]